MKSAGIPIEDRTKPGEFLSVSLSGHALLDNPLLNKGTAFPVEERVEFGLLGLLPPHISTVEEQLARTYGNYQSKHTDLERFIFLISLQDRNETLFYKLLSEHISEMTPIIYTPVVGEGCRYYSRSYRRPRGVYISYDDRDQIPQLLDNAPNRDVDVIVVTDGERILGLGDLGVGGLGIPVGKLSLYSLCAGIPPSNTLPIVLDIGTNNKELLADPLYLGLRQERVRGQQYDDFIEAFVEAVINRSPRVLLQWEDFSKANATRLLEKYRDRLCTFNDDIQGTGAVTLAGLLAAVKAAGTRINEQRVVMMGAGSAATGIANQIVAAMMTDGLSQEEALSAIWLVDSKGLVHTGCSAMDAIKRRYAQPMDRVSAWKLDHPDNITLADVVRNVRPTALIGTSAQPGAFTEDIVREMASFVKRPIIFPLSNPTSKSEATPQDLIEWTAGRAMVATGSPYAPVSFGGEVYRIGQCNNVFIFPGVGLGVIASRARRVTTQMFVAAANRLSEFSPALADNRAPLFPSIDDVRTVSREVALTVASEAVRAGLAEQASSEELTRRVDAKMWRPEYLRYARVAGPPDSLIV
ncbi:MAG: NAD-dependent malic enzyme [Acidobacteriota bacterium]